MVRVHVFKQLLSLGVSQDVLAYHIRPIHVALYKDLHSTIAEQFEELSSGEQHLTLSTNGRILQYDDYYPGRNFDGSMDTISYDVMEKNFKLTDIIPKGNLIVTDLSNAKSLSETYEFLVRQLRVVPMNVGPNEMQEARLYLQEKVEDLGSTDSNSTRPRLSLYIQYKTKYYEKKLSIDNQIEAQKNFLSGYYFSEWFDRHSSLLNGQVENAYIQWVMYGYKDDVEKWLKLLQLQDTGSSPLDYNESLEEAKALLIASKERSKFKEDSVYRPVKLVPDYWFRILKNRYVYNIIKFICLSQILVKRTLTFINTLLFFSCDIASTGLKRALSSFCIILQTCGHRKRSSRFLSTIFRRRRSDWNFVTDRPFNSPSLSHAQRTHWMILVLL